MVDNEDDFASVFSHFCKWLEDIKLVSPNSPGGHNIMQHNFAFITCGDWDLKYMLPNQCITSQIILPNYFNEWINVKRSYADSKRGKFPRSLLEMLDGLNLTFEGRQHSGIDDVKNIANIVQKLAKERCYIFDHTHKNN